MWVTNKLGYDLVLAGVTLHKNSQQQLTDAQATALNANAIFTAMITEGVTLIATQNQPSVDPQMFVRAVDAVPTLNGMPTNPEGYPSLTPAQTFDIGKSEGDVDLEDNKTATINVSTYTEAVEIEPSDDYDGMKKATVTLSNIPALENNKTATINVSTYTEAVEVEPSDSYTGMKKATVTLSNIPVLEEASTTIDVSTYTEPIVVTPTEGKDGMSQITITLTGIQ